MAAAERSFPAFDPLAGALAGEIAARLADGVARRGSASLAATGGATPAPIYAALAALDAPWDRIAVTLSDERWVDLDDPASNEGMLRRTLLQGRAAGARVVGLKTGDATPEAAEPAVDAAVQAMARPFEASLLGMGDDGHVASLFPHATELACAFDERNRSYVCAVHRPGAAGAAERLSMTRRALLDSRWIVIAIRGEAKREVVRRAMDGDDVFAMPVRIVLQQTLAPVEVWWSP